MAINLPKHEAGLFLTHNEHKGYYQTAKEWLDCRTELPVPFETPAHRQRAIDTDSIWVLQWYPDTPVGFKIMGAPTLEDLLEWVNREEPDTRRRCPDCNARMEYYDDRNKDGKRLRPDFWECECGYREGA